MLCKVLYLGTAQVVGIPEALLLVIAKRIEQRGKTYPLTIDTLWSFSLTEVSGRGFQLLEQTDFSALEIIKQGKQQRA